MGLRRRITLQCSHCTRCYASIRLFVVCHGDQRDVPHSRLCLLHLVSSIQPDSSASWPCICTCLTCCARDLGRTAAGEEHAAGKSAAGPGRAAAPHISAAGALRDVEAPRHHQPAPAQLMGRGHAVRIPVPRRIGRPPRHYPLPQRCPQPRRPSPGHLPPRASHLSVLEEICPVPGRIKSALAAICPNLRPPGWSQQLDRLWWGPDRNGTGPCRADSCTTASGVGVRCESLHVNMSPTQAGHASAQSHAVQLAGAGDGPLLHTCSLYSRLPGSCDVPTGFGKDCECAAPVLPMSERVPVVWQEARWPTVPARPC